MTDPSLLYAHSLGAVYDSSSIDIEAFRGFPIVCDRLRQLHAASLLAPKEGYALEFGVYKANSIRFLAHKFPKKHFYGFDSFEGLPEAWHQSASSVYQPGHFTLSELPPVTDNITLVKGFFDQTLEAWLSEHPGAVSFVHEDPDLYSSAKYTLDQLTDRVIDGTVIVFDELCDWEDSGVYPNWPEGEWRALCEWLKETGFRFRILSRSGKYQAAIQVFRGTPPPLTSQRILEYATALWTAGCRQQAIAVLAERAAQKPNWNSGNYTLLTWYDKARDSEGVQNLLARLSHFLEANPTHSYAIEAHRLEAIAHYREQNNLRAYDSIRKYLELKPDSLSGLKFAGRCASACRDYESAQDYWHRAYAFSNDKQCRVEARMAELQSEIRTDLRAMKFSNLMIHHIIHEREFETVLDIGSGAGEQASSLRDAGKTVTELDYGESKYFVLNPHQGGSVIGDFMEIEISEKFDCVIASHVLEHQPNVGAFLRKLHAVLREGGILAISVPPAKPEIVGGHVTIWNAGLLLYNLVLAGFDCSTPWVRRYGYNISVVVKKKTISAEGLHFDSGDIDRIRDFLPEGFEEGFNGDIYELG